MDGRTGSLSPPSPPPTHPPKNGDKIKNTVKRYSANTKTLIYCIKMQWTWIHQAFTPLVLRHSVNGDILFEMIPLKCTGGVSGVLDHERVLWGFPQTVRPPSAGQGPRLWHLTGRISGTEICWVHFPITTSGFPHPVQFVQRHLHLPTDQLSTNVSHRGFKFMCTCKEN